MLLYIHTNVDGMGFQAWILQHDIDSNGNTWYERVGGVYHHMSMSDLPLRKKEFRLYNQLMQLSRSSLQSFDIL